MGHNLNFTNEREILTGLDTEPNAKVFCIANYPTQEFMSKCDDYLTRVKPPNKLWDEYIHFGRRGAGWHKFEGDYLQNLQENQKAYRTCQQLRARSTVRPLYFAHHVKRKDFSPARLLIDFIKYNVKTPAEQPNDPLGLFESV